jgi:hypothetical protein
MTSWFGMNQNGDVYRYFFDNVGGAHYSGTIPPNEYQHLILNSVLKQLGIKL